MSKKRVDVAPPQEAVTEHDAQRFNRLSATVNASLKKGVNQARLSLTYHISLHYCAQLLRSFLWALLLITLVFLGAEGWRVSRVCARVAQSLPDSGSEYSQLIIQSDEISATLLEEGAADVTLLPRGLSEVCFPLSIEAGGTARTAQITLRTLPMAQRWCLMALALLLCDGMRMLYFTHHHRRLDKRVLAPIRDITALAATLSASNLSNRINEAGTKDELRDLAVVINSMLDRIEQSYNSEKQFVSDASHELRTPIAVVQGYADMLRRWGKDDPEVLEEGLTAIANESENMKELVENLLFLARHDKKTLMMEMTPFDPCEVLEEVHREAELVTPQDQFLLDPLEHCVIEADRAMVKQVTRILLDNAVKYTPPGGTITLGCSVRTDGCQLSVSDNGIGIASEDLPHIFDRFYRADKARKSENGGHGLGLSIARIIVMAHGGKIRVRSKVGEGTTFLVLLPLKPEEAKEAVQS